MEKSVRIIFTILIIFMLILLGIMVVVLTENVIKIEKISQGIENNKNENTNKDNNTDDKQEDIIAKDQEMVWRDIFDGNGKELVVYKKILDLEDKFYIDFKSEVEELINNESIKVKYSFKWESNEAQILRSNSKNYTVIKNQERYYIIDLEDKLIAKVSLPSEVAEVMFVENSDNETVGILFNDIKRTNSGYYSIESKRLTMPMGSYSNLDYDVDLFNYTGYMTTYKDTGNGKNNVYLFDSRTGEEVLENKNCDKSESYKYVMLGDENNMYIATSVYTTDGTKEYLAIYDKKLNVIYSDYLNKNTLDCKRITNVDFDDENLTFDVENESYILDDAGKLIKI